MTKQVNFDSPPPRYAQYPNKVEYVREHVLGLNRPKLIENARKKHGTFQISTQTLKNVERLGRANLTTLTKVSEATNALLEDHGYAPVARDVLLQPF